ncbi:hypothetical protein MKX54_11150 [Alkalihalobacillus sp. FSL R5-0424]
MTQPLKAHELFANEKEEFLYSLIDQQPVDQSVLNSFDALVMGEEDTDD